MMFDVVMFGRATGTGLEVGSFGKDDHTAEVLAAAAHMGCVEDIVPEDTAVVHNLDGSSSLQWVREVEREDGDGAVRHG